MSSPPAPVLRRARGLVVCLALLAGAAGSVVACNGGNGEGSRALHELERLAFVPAAPGIFEGFLVDCSLERAIVIDLYEFTREDGLFYGYPADRRHGSFVTDAATRGDEKLRWPRFMDYREAVEIAEKRGMRLPMAKEWLHVATDRGNNGYPWARTRFQAGVANTVELGVGTPLPVGTFENGRSIPFGCYDMMGNVWEWVQDVAPGYLDDVREMVSFNVVDPDADPEDLELRHIPIYRVNTDLPLDQRQYSSVLGGAYDSSTEREGRRIFGRRHQGWELCFCAKEMHRDTLAPNIGARMCADADAYLWEKAPAWGSSPAAQARIRATGARWAAIPTGAAVREFLDDLASREGAPPALTWLAEGARE